MKAEEIQLKADVKKIAQGKSLFETIPLLDIWILTQVHSTEKAEIIRDPPTNELESTLATIQSNVSGTELLYSATQVHLRSFE